MAISVFDMFTIGIGPSSSHTVGPMKAARRFALALEREGQLEQVASVRVELFGSLGHTGKGHGTDKAVLLGLEGEQPDSVDIDAIPARLATILERGSLALLGRHRIELRPAEALVFHRRQTLPRHPNGMRFFAFNQAGEVLREGTYYSVGGGFLIDEHVPRRSDFDGLGLVPDAPGFVARQSLGMHQAPSSLRARDARPGAPNHQNHCGGVLAEEDRLLADQAVLPHPFSSGDELLERCRATGLSVSTLMRENEAVWRSDAQIRQQLARIWTTMQACVERGCQREGILPGGLAVKRRAAGLARRLRGDPQGEADPLRAMDWVNLYAIAVNEENAAGGRVVTAPTNGAAGIIPAVLHFYRDFYVSADQDGIERFLLTAGAIGIIYKTRA
ncbi:MAG TPA: serine dehydratase beta chain, partial [Enhygromyxa sp.]|nr:serine dehydratase beta chain [Enhygromyxa sp.]